MTNKKSPPEKISNIPPFGLRMMPSLKQRIEQAAQQNNRSMNAEIVARLEQSFLSAIAPDGVREVAMSRGEYHDLMAKLDRIGSLLGEDPVPPSADASEEIG